MSRSNAQRCHLGVAAALIAAWGVACSGSAEPQCRVGADCASGACSKDGVCLPLADGGAEADAMAVDATSTDAGLDDASAPDAGDAGSVGCRPNADGVLERSEAPIGAGLHATFRITTSHVDVDTAGTGATSTGRRWDFTARLDGDHDVETTTDAPTGKWYSADFPTATYVTELSDGSALLGVFEVSETSLKLLGVVSPDQDLSFTEVTYDPPVEVLQFPLRMGKTWSTDTWATGYYSGITLGLGYSESYAYEVSAAGDLLTPFSTTPFPVFRVSVDHTKTVGFLVTTNKTMSYLAECFGPVAAITSEDGETNEEFTTAAEVRRLSP